VDRYLKPGNGAQHANHEKAMKWSLSEFGGAERVDNKRIRLSEKTYHTTYSAEQKSIMLAGTKHGKSDELPPFLADVDGTLVLRQLNDGRLFGHRFEGARKLWDAMVAISWEKASPLSGEAIVRRFDG
jgi:hypothetical protein